MRVLVTGGAGFLGSHVVDLLLMEGHDVRVVDDLSAGQLAHVPAGVALINKDIREPLVSTFCEIRPEVVVHLAAQVSVPESVKNPGRDLEVNGIGSVNVMIASAESGVRKVIAVSSAAVYGRPTSLPIAETSLGIPLSPYGASKQACENYVGLLARTFGIEHTILRPANLYGPRQSTKGEGAVVPSFLKHFLRYEHPVIHGNGTQTRDFVYAGDMARAIRDALYRGDGLVLNIGSGSGTTILELWSALAGFCGWTKEPVFGPVRAGDISHSVLDPRAAHETLGWSPTTALMDGLAGTWAWYAQNQAVATSQYFR